MGNTYSVVDIFSGIGGTSLGFIKAGFHIRCCVTMNEKETQVLRCNGVADEVRTLEFQKMYIKELPEADVYLMKLFQTFGLLERRRGVESYAESILFDLVVNKRPKAIVLHMASILWKNVIVKEYIEKLNDWGRRKWFFKELYRDGI